MQQISRLDKTVGFDILCPNWSNEIKAHHEFTSLKEASFTSKDGRVMALSNAKCCIVGEAHS